MKIIEGICDYFNFRFANCIDQDFQHTIIPIEYDGSTVINHPLYSAEWSVPFQSFKINALYLDLTTETGSSWVLLLENNNFFYIFKNIDGEFSIVNQNNKEIALEFTCLFISAFEKMINSGFSWKPQKASDELIKIINQII